MDKAGTSRKRGASFSASPLKIRPDAGLIPHDPSATLRDPAFIRSAILQALDEGDYDEVVDIYRSHLRVLNRTRAAKAMGVSRQYLHKMIRTTPSPSLKTFAAFMGMLRKERAWATCSWSGRGRRRRRS